MDYLFQWLCEEVGRVLYSWDVVDSHNLAVDAVTYEVRTDVDVLHV
jgi:hypothetical protein